MYNDKEKYFDKEPSKMTEEGAKQAVAYWRGRFEAKQYEPCSLPHYQQPPQPSGIDTGIHYHNGTPCLNNPCVWC